MWLMTLSFQQETPRFFASGSIQCPTTCSVSCEKVFGLIFCASLRIWQGDQGFPAQMAASSICNHRKGENQLKYLALVGSFLCFRPTGLFFWCWSSLQWRRGHEASALGETDWDVLKASRVAVRFWINCSASASTWIVKCHYPFVAWYPSHFHLFLFRPVMAVLYSAPQIPSGIR